MAEIREADVEFKRTLGVKWIMGASGQTYLCPVDAYNRLDNPTEDQLDDLCGRVRQLAKQLTGHPHRGCTMPEYGARRA